MTKPLFVPDWCPKDILDGTAQMEPMEELVYRRLLDWIYATDGNLKDDDRRLAELTKAGRRWKRIKKSLIEQGKVEVKWGLISNLRCQISLSKRRDISEINRTRALKMHETRRAAHSAAEGAATHATRNPYSKVGSELVGNTESDIEDPVLNVAFDHRGTMVRTDAKANSVDLDAEFETWWQAVWLKVGKKGARAKYLTARRTGVNQAQMIAGRDRYIATKPSDQAWCHPKTWLNDGRWADEPAKTLADVGQDIFNALRKDKP